MSRNKSAILIVEDEQDWRTLLSENLDPCDVTFAENYAKAINVIKASSFDAIILDLRLEDRDDENFQGMELLALLREKEKEKDWNTNVIIVSAYGTPQQVREGFKIHCLFDYILKQKFDKREYREIVRQAISNRQPKGS